MLIKLILTNANRLILASAAMGLILFGQAAHSQTGNIASGETLYSNNCFTCHGEPRFSPEASKAVSVSVLNNAFNSSNQMKALFNSGSFFSTQQKADIVAYIVSQVSGPTKQNQTISFPAVGSFAWNSPGVILAATASSGLPVSYSVAFGPCFLSGSRLTAGSASACTIAANQAGNSSFNAAPQLTIAVTTTTLALSRRGGVDIDGDGRGEIVVRNSLGSTSIGRLNSTSGQIVFTPTTDPGPNFRYVGLLDFARNDRTDLAIQNLTQGEFGDVSILNEFVPNFPLLMRTVKRTWDVQAVGDLDGDGFGDLVWRYLGASPPDRPNDTGVSYVWFTSGGGGVPAVKKRGGAPLDWQLLGAADLNGDGAADMVYISPQGQVRVLMATADRTCANFAAGAIPIGFSALKLADFSGNGRAEILLRNNTSGEVRLMALDAVGLTLPPFVAIPGQDAQDAPCTATTTTITNSISVLPTTDPTWRFYASDDLDGDGRFDVIWRQADGTLTFWKMNGTFNPVVTPNAGMAPAGFQPNATTPASSPVF